MTSGHGVCVLPLTDLRYRGSKTSYSAENGIRRGMMLTGFVSPPDRPGNCDPEAVLHDKAIHLHILSHPGSETPRKIKEDTGDDRAFGLVTIRPGVEPHFGEFGEYLEPPIKAYLYVSSEAFKSIRQEIMGAQVLGRAYRARLAMVGRGIPDVETPSLSDIDVSGDVILGVADISLVSTRHAFNPLARVLPRGRGHLRWPALMVKIEGLEYNGARRGEMPDTVKLIGVVISGPQSYVATASASFTRFEIDEVDYPQEPGALGEFGYYRYPLGEESGCPPHYSFRLNCSAHYIESYLLPLMSNSSGSNIVLSLELVASAEELADGNIRGGDVGGYYFDLRTTLDDSV